MDIDSFHLGIIDAYKSIHNLKDIPSDHAEKLVKLIEVLTKIRKDAGVV